MFEGTVTATDMSRATDAREKDRIGIFGTGISYAGSYGRVTSESIGRDLNPLGRGAGQALVGGDLEISWITPSVPLSKDLADFGTGSSINNPFTPPSGAEFAFAARNKHMRERERIHQHLLNTPDWCKSAEYSRCKNRAFAQWHERSVILEHEYYLETRHYIRWIYWLGVISDGFHGKNMDDVLGIVGWPMTAVPNWDPRNPDWWGHDNQHETIWTELVDYFSPQKWYNLRDKLIDGWNQWLSWKRCLIERDWIAAGNSNYKNSCISRNAYVRAHVACDPGHQCNHPKLHDCSKVVNNALPNCDRLQRSFMGNSPYNYPQSFKDAAWDAAYLIPVWILPIVGGWIGAKLPVKPTIPPVPLSYSIRNSLTRYHEKLITYLLVNAQFNEM